MICSKWIGSQWRPGVGGDVVGRESVATTGAIVSLCAVHNASRCVESAGRRLTRKWHRCERRPGSCGDVVAIDGVHNAAVTHTTEDVEVSVSLNKPIADD